MQSLQKLKNKKKGKNLNNILLLVNNKLNTTKSLISRALIVSYINHDEFVLVNNLLREFDEIKEKIKNSQNAVEYTV